MQAAAIASRLNEQGSGSPGTPRRDRRTSGPGSRSESPSGIIKPVPPSSVPQSVWDNIAHKRSSSDELVQNFRSQYSTGDFTSQSGFVHNHNRDPSPKDVGGSRQRPQSAGAHRSQPGPPLTLPPDANMPIHLMSATNEQRVVGQMSQQHLPMKLASLGGKSGSLGGVGSSSGSQGVSSGPKASRSQSLSIPHKLPMKLAHSSSSAANHSDSAPRGPAHSQNEPAPRSTHPIPAYTSSSIPSSSIPMATSISQSNAAMSSPPVTMAANPFSHTSMTSQQQTVQTSSGGHISRSRVAAAHNSVNSTSMSSSVASQSVAMGTKRTVTSPPSGVAPATHHGGMPAKGMPSTRSQPSMHLGGGIGQRGVGVTPSQHGGPPGPPQPQSILPMKLATGSKTSSSKINKGLSPKSPVSVLPGSSSATRSSPRQLISPPEGAGRVPPQVPPRSYPAQISHPGAALSHSNTKQHSQQQKPDTTTSQKQQEEIIYF